MLEAENEENYTILAKFLNITNDDQNKNGAHNPNHTIIMPLEQLQQLEMKFYLTPNHACAHETKHSQLIH